MRDCASGAALPPPMSAPAVPTPPRAAVPRTAVARPAADPVATRRLLVVDDEEGVRLALCRFLRSRGFDVTAADSGSAALELLASDRFQLMICDVRMPGLSGIDLVPQALDLDAELAILMLTGVNDAPTAAEAFTHGAMDYLIKPVELPALQHAVERALHRRELVVERRDIEAMVRDQVVLRTEQLEAEKAALHQLTVRVAETLINAMEAKDVFLRGHSQRVAELGASMASVLGLDDDTIEHVRLAGRLHDVGRIGIREAVLNKPGKLTPEEVAHIRDHVRIGMEILAPLAHLGVVLRFVQDHHERWDGTGYPNRLSGEEASIGGRILCAADAFDAITSRRAWREPMSAEQTIAYLADYSGTLLDPQVYDALREVVMGRKSIALTFIDDLHR